MCFVDLVKAFDRVLRKVLELAMRKKGIPEVLFRSVVCLYEGAETSVREDFEVKVGMHQGSVLYITIFFSMYVKPLSTIIDSHTIHLLMTHNYKCLLLSKLLHSMQACISDIETWTTASMLKLSDNKTELMFVTPKELSISITYLLQSLLVMLKFPSNSLRRMLR